MPFTPTHIVAILPFQRPPFDRLPFSALAIGSVIPDLPIFFDIGVHYSQMHSFHGVYSYCLLVGLIAYAVFQLFVRQPMLALLPQSVAEHLSGRRSHTPKYVLLVALALIIGAATHVFWDAFTHQNQWGVELLPALNRKFEILGYTFGGYSMLQHLSTIIFLPLLALVGFRYIRDVHQSTDPVNSSRLGTTTKVILILLIFMAPAIWATLEAWLQTRSIYYGIGRAARAYGRYLLSVVLLFSVFMSIWLRLKPR